jgi:hypothetical protein
MAHTAVADHIVATTIDHAASPIDFGSPPSIA